MSTPFASTATRREYSRFALACIAELRRGWRLRLPTNLLRVQADFPLSRIEPDPLCFGYHFAPAGTAPKCLVTSTSAEHVRTTYSYCMNPGLTLLLRPEVIRLLSLFLEL